MNLLVGSVAFISKGGGRCRRRRPLKGLVCSRHLLHVKAPERSDLTFGLIDGIIWFWYP